MDEDRVGPAQAMRARWPSGVPDAVFLVILMQCCIAVLDAMVRQTVDEELVHERMQPAKPDSLPAILNPPHQHNGLCLTPRCHTVLFMNAQAAENSPPALPGSNA